MGASESRRELDESQNLHSGSEPEGNKRTDLNDLLRRVEEERKINNKNNLLLFSCTAAVFVVVLLILNL